MALAPLAREVRALPHAVYRLFDGADDLLYVGMSYDPELRWKSLAATKPWWPKVERKTVEWVGDFPTTRDVEASAIKDERPRYNFQHNLGRPPLRPFKVSISVDDDTLAAFAQACAMEGVSQAKVVQRLIEERAAEWLGSQLDSQAP